MRFNDISELVTYLSETGTEVSDFEVSLIKPIRESKEDQGCSCEPSSKEEVIGETVNTTLLSLSDDPIMGARVGEKNKLFVESFEAIEGMCAMGKIKFDGRELTMGVCESEGMSTVKLDVEVNGDFRKAVPFQLEISDKCGIMVTP